ncbi:HAD family hydrolase [bacterium]|nr:HAD family hydrolase [bacterium]
MKLLIMDIEGTLFQTHVRLEGTKLNSTIWQGIAHRLGADATREEVATHEKWHSNGYRSYLEWMKETIQIHLRYGLTHSTFGELIAAAAYNPGVVTTLQRIDRTRFEPVLVSGGFRELAARAQRELRIHHAFAACEYLFDEEGQLVSYNLLPCDFAGKYDFILLMLREYGLGQDDWVFVGDGLNDVPIAQRAPISIAYNAHPELQKIATYSIDNFLELLTILERA